jgi:hypothetical protein
MSYYASITFFSHSHIISGATISHSHVHKDSHHDSNNGGHTQQDITLIAQISHFENIIFSNSYIPSPIQFPVFEKKITNTPHWITSIHLQHLSLRAPPEPA